MSEDYSVQNTKEMPGWVIVAMLVLAIVSIAGFGLAWRDQARLQELEQSVAAQFQTAQQQHAQTVAALEQKLVQSSESDSALRNDLTSVTGRLRTTQSELSKARAEAEAIREENAKKLEEMGTTVQAELAQKASSEQLSTVNGEVQTVKTDLASTRNDLQLARSELGTLIARNHDEINVLRQLNERDYTEFTIQGRKRPQVVGPVTVELRSVDTKRNRFTVAVVVDDIRTEKRDRLINEPIFFYPMGSRRGPTELVINSVAKDRISGYVSTPKRTPTTTSASSGN
jgi:hypothetical protein